jgi:hypothetical protein
MGVRKLQTRLRSKRNDQECITIEIGKVCCARNWGTSVGGENQPRAIIAGMHLILRDGIWNCTSGRRLDRTARMSSQIS